MKESSFPQRLIRDDQDNNLVQDQDAPETVPSVQLFEDKEAADASREIQALLSSNDTSKALLACDRMLSVHPGNRLFEGLRLEIENKEREIRLEFVRRLSAELEKVPDLDYRVSVIQQALNRYPTESQLAQLLKNARATRDFFTGLIAEARQEEMSENYSEALKRWYVIRVLFPAMPGLEDEVHRVESLTHTQVRMNRRAEFVEAISRLNSTGEYARAVHQCINALAEYPNDLGILSLKRNAEEKVRHGTELQQFIFEGLTFLQAHEADAALESFTKARKLDQNNLQVRYLVGITLLEKARAVMYKDRQRVNALLDEAKGLIPEHPELKTLSLEHDRLMEEYSDRPLIPAARPGADLTPDAEQTSTAAPAVTSPEPPPAPSSSKAPPGPTPKDGSLRKLAVFGLLVLAALSIVWFVYSNSAKRPGPGGAVAVSAPTGVDIKATPEGAEIFVDGQRVGQSQVQTQLARGNHTVVASLAGYDSKTLALELGSDARSIQIDLQPILLDLHIVTDQPGGSVWLDDQPQGEITESGITLSGVHPGARILRMRTSAGEIELTFDFPPGKAPTLKSLPPRQIATVFFVGGADGKAHVECNCAPAGVRVGELAELIRAEGVEIPLAEGPHQAELWVGKNHRSLTIHGGRSPVVTIAVFHSLESIPVEKKSDP